MSVEMTPDENEIARAQQDRAELVALYVAKLDERHARARAMIVDLGCRDDVGLIAAENGAKVVAEYAATLRRALEPWGRYEAGPMLKAIKEFDEGIKEFDRSQHREAQESQ
jgi:hypothetical protein